MPPVAFAHWLMMDLALACFSHYSAVHVRDTLPVLVPLLDLLAAHASHVLIRMRVLKISLSCS